jgi:glycosyltransferase involved in cell wall biosynthesis
MKIIVFSPTSTLLELREDQPLGGADSMLLKMIEYLAQNNEVLAFIPIRKELEGLYKGAKCYPFMELFDYERDCDIIIHYRKVYPIPNIIKYKHAVFYSQDTIDTPCFHGMKGNRKALDMYSRVWVLSRFHKQDMLEMFDISEEKFLILGNAAEEQKLVEKTPLSFIYASTPYRGLDVLLKLWLEIVKKYPTATLHIFSSMKIYGAEQLDDLHFGKMYKDMKEGRFKNLVFHGSVPQKEMLEQMKKSFMLLYPNTYPETFCNVLLEARACHTPFITSNLGALPETGRSAGLYVDIPARHPGYISVFLNLLDYIIADTDFYSHLQKNCYPIRTFSRYKEDLMWEIGLLKRLKGK